MITIFDPRVVAVPTILDAKLCNYYLDVESSQIVIEDISEYLTRVISGHRSAGAPVTMLMPKDGYTPLDSYEIEDYETALSNFNVRYYTFRDGLTNDDFVQINVNTTNSVMGDGYIGSEIQLLNDEDAPGPLKYYGTGEDAEKGFHDLHLPVTIDPLSVDLASIDANQVLTLTPVHQPVTIAPESSALASIDENQVLTLVPQPDSHLPVTIATTSESIASIDSNQVLTINPAAIGHNPVTIALGSESMGSIDENQVLTLTPVSGAVAGLGMDFVAGDPVAMGTPSTITSSTLNELTTNSHTHKITDIDISSVSKANGYGALYNWWVTQDSRQITSSDDFRIPLNSDFQALYFYIGGLALMPGDAIKESGTTHWRLDNEGSNVMQFTAVGSGLRAFGNFVGIKEQASFYTSETGSDDTYGMLAGLAYDSSDLQVGYPTASYMETQKNNGISLRLVREATVGELSLPDGLIIDTYIGNDGEIYPCTKIGDQIWTAKNLIETKYRDGSWIHGFDGGIYTPISDEDWVTRGEAEESLMCYYNDNEANGSSIDTPISEILDDLQTKAHNPVTIATESSSIASIDANQVLTIAEQTFIDSLPDTLTSSTTNSDDGSLHTHEVEWENAEFIKLFDVPETYLGQAGKIVKVRVAEDGLEFSDGGAGTSSYTYIGYASNTSGAGFSTSPNSTLKYIAVKTSDTVLTPVVGDFAGLWQKYLGDDGVAASMGYKEYIAFISQTGTSSPSEIVQKNDIGTITWSRVSVGVYRATSAALFITDRTSPIDDIMQDQLGNLYTLNWISTSVMELRTYAYTDITVLSDSVLNKRYVNFCISLLP